MKRFLNCLKKPFNSILDAYQQFNTDERVFFWAIVLFAISYYTSAISIIMIPIYALIKRKNIFKHKMTIPLMAFTVIALVSAIVAKYPLGIILAIGGIFPSLMVTLYAISSIRKEKLILFFRCFVILGIPSMVYAVFQFLYHMIFVYPYMPTPYLLQVTSSYANASIYAFILMFYVMVAFALMFAQSEKGHRGWYLAAILLGFAAMYLTGSRSIWPAVALGLFVQFLVLRKYKIVYGITIACSVLVAVVVLNHSLIPRFTLLTESLSQRYETWDCAIRAIKESPFFGKGMLSYRFFLWDSSPARSHAHNLVLSIWSEYGLVGLLAAGAAFIWAIRDAFFQYRKQEAKIENAVTLAYFAGLMVLGVVDNPIFNLGIGFVFVFMLAVPAIMRKQDTL